MNDTELIISRIKSLEAQLHVLKAQIGSLPTQPIKPGHSFAEVYGRLRGQVDSSEEEINSVLYQLPEGEQDRS
ncbi:MAG: hypothetical protein HY694_03800 [Deltaproteobacteria bacterium]|nr:hypothetical protein [Deltaproteobacteria bacterium]